MENYFNYFTEIEEHFQRCWGGILRLSTLDWALIETWKDAGIPLEAVLRGIDATFENYEKRRRSPRKINGIGFCAQEVLAAAEEMKEATVGFSNGAISKKPIRGFEISEIVAFLNRCAAQIQSASLPQASGISGQTLAMETAGTLNVLADEVSSKPQPRLQDLEQRLTVLEEKLYAVLFAATPDQQIVDICSEADRELAPYRSRMPATQIQQLQKQYLHKKLLERYKLPRLSLFYM